MVLQSVRSNVPTSNCLFPAASEAEPVNSMYFNILFAVLFGILEDDPANPRLFPVPCPKFLSLMLGSVDDNHTFPC